MRNQYLMIGLIVMTLLSGCATGTRHPPQPDSDEAVITRWRIKQITFQEVETGQTPFDRPTGQHWQEFKARAKPGDELWYFCSPGETWEKLMGWRGYAIFRKGELIAEYTTAEN